MVMYLFISFPIFLLIDVLNQPLVLMAISTFFFFFRFGIVFKIVQREGDYILLDTQQEEHSNWMIFVRPAEKKAEQNLVAYQYLGEIFFATIKVERGVL